MRDRPARRRRAGGRRVRLPGPLRQVRRPALAREQGLRGRLRPADHAVAFPARGGRRRRGRVRKAVAVFELNAGQMIEDVRLAVLGRVPVHADRRHQPRPLRASASGPLARAAEHHRAASPTSTGGQGGRMTTHRPPLKKVFAKPDLLLRTEHSLCPGCGEPLALRADPRADPGARPARPHHLRRRHRLLHRLSADHGRRRPAGAARPRAVGRDRRQARAARCASSSPCRATATWCPRACRRSSTAPRAASASPPCCSTTASSARPAAT